MRTSGKARRPLRTRLGIAGAAIGLVVAIPATSNAFAAGRTHASPTTTTISTVGTSSTATAAPTTTAPTQAATSPKSTSATTKATAPTTALDTTAQTRATDPRVGALFAAGSTSHGCTATVIDSPTGNEIVTAAHCVNGTGAGMTFAPGWTGSASSAGTWTVTAAYVDSAYEQGNSQDDDIAVLTVANRTVGGRSVTLQSQVGAYSVANNPLTSSDVVTVPAYPAGTGGQVTCTAKVTMTGGRPTLPCGGYVAGVSGAPFLTTAASGTSEVAAILGGLDQGGCTDSVSYATTAQTLLPALVTRAASGAAGDAVPDAIDSCV